jgi:hypothetical protein
VKWCVWCRGSPGVKSPIVIPQLASCSPWDLELGDWDVRGVVWSMGSGGCELWKDDELLGDVRFRSPARIDRRRGLRNQP